jgi:quercetin dioxygenase-like cupin family protein
LARLKAIAPVIGMLTLTLVQTLTGQSGSGVRYTVIGPAELKWEKNSTQSGPLTAVLFGDPAKQGPYIIRVRFPPNILNGPHSHPDDRFITILSGTALVGQGGKPDRERTVKLVPGSFFTQPAKVVHYEFTGPDEVTIQVSGVGPTSADFVK